jgi:hypothetical protein
MIEKRRSWALLMHGCIYTLLAMPSLYSCQCPRLCCRGDLFRLLLPLWVVLWSTLLCFWMFLALLLLILSTLVEFGWSERTGSGYEMWCKRCGFLTWVKVPSVSEILLRLTNSDMETDADLCMGCWWLMRGDDVQPFLNCMPLNNQGSCGYLIWAELSPLEAYLTIPYCLWFCA